MQYEEHYAGFTAAGALLIVVAALSAGTLLRRLP